MRFAFVRNNVIEAIDVLLPGSARVLATDELVSPNGGLAAATTELRESCGYFEIVEVPPPALQPSERAEYEIQLVNGDPTQVWTIRAETAEELAGRTQATNRNLLSDVPTLQTKIDELKSFLADVDVETVLNRNNNAPFDATDRRALKAMIRQQRREANATIRLFRALFGGSLLEDISDT